MPISGNARGKNKKSEILFFPAGTFPVVARGETGKLAEARGKIIGIRHAGHGGNLRNRKIRALQEIRRAAQLRTLAILTRRNTCFPLELRIQSGTRHSAADSQGVHAFRGIQQQTFRQFNSRLRLRRTPPLMIEPADKNTFQKKHREIKPSGGTVQFQFPDLLQSLPHPPKARYGRDRKSHLSTSTPRSHAHGEQNDTRNKSIAPEL